MAVNTRGRDMMLPILLFPVALPLLMAAVRASGNILAESTDPTFSYTFTSPDIAATHVPSDGPTGVIPRPTLNLSRPFIPVVNR